ncbi:hypothetical protein AMQ83_02950 [Paenibacillus riograndensis]|nr:hypothetical protein AMQ83_02950 [Paenibacillus riograndensis]
MKPKYLHVSTISFVSTLEYRMDFVFGLLSKFFPAIIQFFMWTAIFTNSPDSIILNYTYNEMILYTVLSIFVSSLVTVDVQYSISSDIKNGMLSKYLILPVNYFFYKVFQFIGSKISDVLVIVLGMGIVLVFFNANQMIEMNWVKIFNFGVVAVMAFVVQYLITFLFANIAFWIGECGGIFTVINVISLIISGAIFPLDIFGDRVIAISKLFPFYYITYFPSNVLIGKISGAEVASGLLIMVLWVLGLSLFCCVIWNHGKKKYIAAGG